MINIKKFFEDERDEAADVLDAKKIMEGILEKKIGDAFNREEITSLAQKYKIFHPGIFYKAWKELTSELEDGTTFVNTQKSYFGKMRPTIFNRETFKKGEVTRHIGLYTNN